MFVVLKYLEYGMTARSKALELGMVSRPKARQTHLGSMPAQTTLVEAVIITMLRIIIFL